VTGTSFGLQLQQLTRATDRVLVLGKVAGDRTEDGWFAPVDVARLLEALHLPPTKVSNALARLREDNLVIRRGGGQGWALTPLGLEKVRELFGDIDYVAIAAALVGSPGAEFAHVRHSVLDPAFAPPRWSAGIKRLLERYPFDTNVFCMTRYPEDDAEVVEPDPVRGVVEVLRKVLDGHGLTLHLASDRQVDDELFGNVGAHMWACRYGIGLLEDRTNRGLNYNAAIELGSMLITGRRCAILKDHTAPNLPVNLSGQIYKAVDFDDLAAVREQAHLWVADDLGLERCETCPSGPGGA
jgi:DNA-binding transcriptional ArsR family regulator